MLCADFVDAICVVVGNPVDHIQFVTLHPPAGDGYEARLAESLVDARGFRLSHLLFCRRRHTVRDAQCSQLIAVDLYGRRLILC